MRILISGICGFVGSKIAEHLKARSASYQISGIDNLTRRGSWVNLARLQELGIDVIHGDVRNQSDMETLQPVDWVVDAAASPSVLAGVQSTTSSRQLIETNLMGTVNLLEYCKSHRAGMVLLSSSRVYSIPELAAIPLRVADHAFQIDDQQKLPQGLTPQGVGETFPTTAPISLYGATKLSSEALVHEYSYAFEMPVWINRCGVLAGKGQFGKADQGIFAFWLHSWKERANLRYLGFEGHGHQVRDCLHPFDLAELIEQQITSTTGRDRPTVVNVSGGVPSAMSLARLSAWCTERWGGHHVEADQDPRPYDIPWIVLDHSLATESWEWKPRISTEDILTKIADHADTHPDWLAMSR